MTVTFKYIIVNTGAILFGENTTHSGVADGLGKVYSAGFVKMGINPDLSIWCFGQSTSLGIVSNPPKDHIIIMDLFSRLSAIKYLGFDVKEFYEAV